MVKLINPNQTDSSAALIVTEYEQINGAEKLTKIHTVDLLTKSGKVGDDEMRGIMEKTYTITLDSAESLSDVYFWTDSDDMVSLWNGLVGQEG